MKYQLSTAGMAHFPLVLQGADWSVSFRSIPSPAVEVVGRAPTRDELWQCLLTGGVSPWLIAECLLIAAQAAPLPTSA